MVLPPGTEQGAPGRNGVVGADAVGGLFRDGKVGEILYMAQYVGKAGNVMVS